MEELIRKYALQNAVLHDGKCNEKAVISKVMAERPELRAKVREVISEVRRVVDEVNTLSIEKQRSELEMIAPELLERRRGRRKAVLPALKNVKEKVVMRFAPGPSGPLHLGHSRAAVLNDEYVKRYKGRLILRIEDTNPENIESDAYEQIPEDLEWLGVVWHETILQSDRFEIYYEQALKLLEMGKAYICTCRQDDWRELKMKMKPCPHRELPNERQLELWEMMMNNEFGEGEACYIVKTDLQHPNPAIRDFVGFRILEREHPRTKQRYSVYPMMNFSVAVDDHLLGLTHVLRGKDHLNNTYRQEYIFDYFGWRKPEYIHYGWVSIEGTILKTSLIKGGILSNAYSGWNDVRLGTIRALARRGIRPEAIRRVWIEMGIKDVDIQYSWETLYSYNKEIVDSKANRYFFVWDAKEIVIEGVENLEGHAPLHPDFPDRGVRLVRLKGRDRIKVFVTADDLKEIKSGEKVRLKDLCNVQFISTSKASYIGDDLSILKEGARIIHWVSEDNIPIRVYMPDGEVKEGLCESGVKNEVDKIVQFERFGFVRIERDDGGIRGCYGHR